MGRRLLLINPSAAHFGRERWSLAAFATMEPLALAYVAALTPPDWEVRIVDETVEGMPSYWSFEPDLVGLTSQTPAAPRAYDVAAHFRARGVPVAMGGMHATFCADEAARFVDVVCQGEAEGLWPQLIDDFESGRLAERYVGGATDLADLPLPRRDLYRYPYRVALVTSARGCNERCEFCAVWKFESGRFRVRPVEQVLAELPRVPSTPFMMFTDDNVMADRDHALEVCRGMQERGLKRRFAVQASLDIADDDELLDALRASGCFLVEVGFESLSEATLKRMRKGVNLRVGVERYGELIGRLHEHGLLVVGTFIFGNDGEGMDVFRRTTDFVLDAGVDLAHFGLLTPTPGTPVFERLARQGRLLWTRFPGDYVLFHTWHSTFVPDAMSPHQAEEGMATVARDLTRWPVALRRAARTGLDTRSLTAAATSLLWTRTGLHRRVFGVR